MGGGNAWKQIKRNYKIEGRWAEPNESNVKKKCGWDWRQRGGKWEVQEGGKVLGPNHTRRGDLGVRRGNIEESQQERIGKSQKNRSQIKHCGGLKNKEKSGEKEGCKDK